jgi:hypothetical protein
VLFLIEPTQAVKDFRKEFEKSILDIQQVIIKDIRDLIGDNQSEIKRIQDIYLGVIFNAAYKHQESGADIDDCLMDEMENTSCDDIAFVELMLSRAMFYGVKCAYHYKNGQMNFALADLIDANYYLGAYRGHACSQLDNESQRREFFQNAASKRHAENRAMREQAIQYYKENCTHFTSKDDAAMNIAGKIVPVAFSTVRGWLKGVNLE